MRFKSQRALRMLGVFLGVALIGLIWSPVAKANHECHLDDNNAVVCPEHEPAQEPEEVDADRDQDGVPDAEDQCPDEPGLAQGPNGPGCPETSDTTSMGEDVDIDLDEEEEPFETRNECVFDPDGIKICLFQAFFPGDEGLEVVRVIDRCDFSGNGSVCERLFERLLCDFVGANCANKENEQTEETCDAQGQCDLRLLSGGLGCDPQFQACVELPDGAFGNDDFAPPLIFEDVVIMQTPETCRDEGSVRICERELYRCVSGVCTRIGRSETHSSCFTGPTGGESCRTQTSVQTCDGDGECTTVTFTDHQVRCNADRSQCSDSTTSYDCVGGGADFSCGGGTLFVRSQRSHSESPGTMRWSDVECDPVTDRCRGTETITTTRADGTTVETASVYDCSEASVADLGFPVGEPECLLKFQQTRTCPPGGPCTINNRRNLGRDSTGRVIHYIQERATGCDPDAIIAEDGCEEGERSEWHCDPSGSPCTKTIRRGWRNTEDSITTWSGEEICELIAPLTFQCRPVDRTTFFSTVLPSGEVERGSYHITCDQDTGMCRDSRSTFTCNDDLSRCSHSRTTHAGLCDARLVREGSCPDGTSSTSSSSERYERTCMPDGSCARSGTVTEYQCEMGERASLCPAQSTTSYTATEQCARADTSPERCTLLSSTSTTTYPDGRMEDETVTCDPTVPSCQIDQRTTNPDGSVGTQSWSCGPSESDDTAPYRNGTCLSLIEER